MLGHITGSIYIYFIHQTRDRLYTLLIIFLTTQITLLSSYLDSSTLSKNLFTDSK